MPKGSRPRPQSSAHSSDSRSSSTRDQRKADLARMDLTELVQHLGLSQSEVNNLRRAYQDSLSKKPKSKAHHDEDESWLDWGLKQVKRFGPMLVEALLAAA